MSADLRTLAAEAPEALARRFHEAYERLAPSFGYETREASAKPWDEVPANNRALMTAVCAEILADLLPEHRRVVLAEAAELVESMMKTWPGMRLHGAACPGTHAVEFVPDAGTDQTEGGHG